ncbi:MAG: hypothetical protein P8X70_01630, partial [Nanoarchaeota archaeon]
METKKYFEDLKKQVDVIYEVMSEARSKGYDPVDKVEIPLAMNMAEKVVGIISTLYPQMEGSGIAERICDCGGQKQQRSYKDSGFRSAGDCAGGEPVLHRHGGPAACSDGGQEQLPQRYGGSHFRLDRIHARHGLKIRNTQDGKEYIEASFSGPIRSAGTTASCIVLMIIDYLREIFGFAKYDPTENEIKRVWTELEHFHDRITNLQYFPTEEEALFLAKNMPIQVAGDPSEKLEVPNYKNLERVDTNF